MYTTLENNLCNEVARTHFHILKIKSETKQCIQSTAAFHTHGRTHEHTHIKGSWYLDK